MDIQDIICILNKKHKMKYICQNGEGGNYTQNDVHLSLVEVIRFLGKEEARPKEKVAVDKCIAQIAINSIRQEGNFLDKIRIITGNPSWFQYQDVYDYLSVLKLVEYVRNAEDKITDIKLTNLGKTVYEKIILAKLEEGE